MDEEVVSVKDMKIMDKQAKKHFLEVYNLKQKELSKRQREYKKILSTRVRSRNETMLDKSYKNAIERLQVERNELRAQIWVADGASHINENNRRLKTIKCLVSCQEFMSDDIMRLKVGIGNLEREISRVNKQVYELNRKTVPDSQHVAHVAKVRKRLNILDNEVEVGVRRECKFTAINAKLRDELIMLINRRTYFNESYTKLVQKLNSEKKYIIDLIEYALGVFDNCIGVYEKIDNLKKRESKERDARKVEMQGIMRKIAADKDNDEFMSKKTQQRELADLQPKEYRRREEFKRMHSKKIALYTKIIKKILAYTKSETVDEVIEKFQLQESLYYSYFNYANEMSYHMTLLNNTVHKLYADINNLKNENRNTLELQIATIAELEETLRKKQEQNAKLQAKRDAGDKGLDEIMQNLDSIFQIVHADASPLSVLLGDHTHINLVNFRRFLKILENRILDITASVYVTERRNEKISFEHYVLRDMDEICEEPTPLEDIVLTQQCPECAEGDAFNFDDSGEDGVKILSIEEVKHNLYEKITQPEMQYRLHSISQCRMPRSRMLAAKRNM